MGPIHLLVLLQQSVAVKAVATVGVVLLETQADQVVEEMVFITAPLVVAVLELLVKEMLVVLVETFLLAMVVIQQVAVVVLLVVVVVEVLALEVMVVQEQLQASLEHL